MDRLNYSDYMCKKDVSYENLYMPFSEKESKLIVNLTDKKSVIILKENGSVLYTSKLFLDHWNINKNISNVFESNRTSDLNSFFIKILGLLKNNTKLTIKQEEITPNQPNKNANHYIERVYYKNQKAIQIESNYLNNLSQLNYGSENKALQLKETFLSLVSHELRTPLNAILGFSNLDISNQPNGEVQNFFKYINMAGNHILQMVEDILYILKLENSSEKLTNFFYSFENFSNDFKLDTKCQTIKFDPSHKKKSNVFYGNYQSISKILIKFKDYCLKKDPKATVTINCHQYDNEFGISTVVNSPIINKSDTDIDSFTYSGYFDKTQQGFSIELDIIKKIVEYLGGKIKIYFLGSSTEIIFMFPYISKKVNPLNFKGKNTILIYCIDQTNYLPLVSFLNKYELEPIFISDLTELKNSEMKVDLLILDINKNTELETINSCHSDHYPTIAIGDNIPNQYANTIYQNCTVITKDEYNLPKILNTITALIKTS